MPQVQLPLFPSGTTHLNEDLAFECHDGQVTYFNGHLPVFTHAQDDLGAFRLFTSQLVVNGSATQGDIRRAFGVPKVAVQRAVDKYRAGGAAAFFVPPKARTGPQAHAGGVGASASPVGPRRVGAARSAVRPACWPTRSTRRSGRDACASSAKKKTLGPAALIRTQSQRRAQDQAAPLGCATTRSEERLLAAVGVLRQAPVQFESAADVPLGGVLWALPALLAEGLLRHSRKLFPLPEGFYPLETIFLVLAFMALVRVRSLEALRYEPPGEWGQLVGLDRIPGGAHAAAETGPALLNRRAWRRAWSSQLAREWMAAQPEHDGVYYADGHVRVYHGKLAALPRRYVARQKLCLRGTTDYWINALDGRPFFLVSRPVDPGLIEVLRTDIVPRLLKDAPGQPTPRPWRRIRLLHRFTLVFDRAGYSPEFFAEQKAQRVAVITYHKFPGEDWPEAEFSSQPLVLANGESVTLSLAERGTCLSNGLWVREIRQREESGHQVSVLGHRLPLRTAAHCGAALRAVDAGKLPQIHAGTLRH